MAIYVLRRLVAGFFVVLGASFIVYILVANAGDPLTTRLRHLRPGRRARPASTP